MSRLENHPQRYDAQRVGKMFVTRDKPCGQPHGVAHLAHNRSRTNAVEQRKSEHDETPLSGGGCTSCPLVLRHTGPFGLARLCGRGALDNHRFPPTGSPP